ncbi:RIP metalloprotease RseP [Halarsenatibacter silvermanii]|uniref:Zinc metalloprotease n=1 Tax=Halarsenatibacter silvermanii TaxID=321763 RepID=A0A1G9LGQ2_9FIRM|nr:RIP metalloprotease RseP [Halarsenatibacter silvermanii]SDL61066.1 regulator of sigma E protease [Halarsenatibacter silvermanii]
MLTTVIAFIIFLGILIFVHELGHFLMARRMDIRVEEFALGFGPKLLSRKKGETRYSIRIIPLGGFCSMTGEMPVDKEDLDQEEREIYEEARENERCFFQKSPLKRLAVLVAGPLMNVALAILAFVLIFGIYGVPVEHAHDAVVGEMFPGEPAARSGIRGGDEILAIEGEEVSSWQEMTNMIRENPGEELNITLQRDEEIKEIQVTPELDEETGYGMIGVLPRVVRERVGPITAVHRGVAQTGQVVVLTVRGFIHIISQASTDELGGPVMIASIVGQAARTGPENVLNWLGIISINLAIINLIPFPALDGGRVIFVLAELISGKKIPQEKEGWVHMVGFVLLILLMIFIIYQDIITTFF